MESSRSQQPALTVVAAGVIVLSALAVYHNSFEGAFIYDDQDSIVENRTIRQLWPLGAVLSPPTGGQTVSGRPLLNFTLALNYALGKLDVWGYHAANLWIHVASALLLFGILRRTFLTPPLRERFGSACTPLALAATLLWTVHPLQTEAVTYIVQRAESLAGCFYLLTLYCTIRGAAPFLTSPGTARGTDSSAIGVPQAQEVFPNTALRWRGSESGSLQANRDDGAVAGRPHPLPTNLRPVPGEGTAKFLWYVVAVLACLLGMATKETIVTAPLVVLLYDRTFLAGSFRAALRRRWPLYVGLAATWGLLICLICSTGLIGRRQEFGTPGWLAYALTQPAVVLHYVRLSFWPKPLCFDYGWPVANTLSAILPAALVTGALLAATAWGLMRCKPAAFLGAWFFLILAPTSSLLPLSQLALEHRMYLSLAAVAVLAVTGAYALWDRLLSGERESLPRDRRHRAQERGHVARIAGLASGLMPTRRPRSALRWITPLVAWAAAVFLLGWATHARNWDYRSVTAIWQDTVNKCPRNPLAHNSLGVALARSGDRQKAIEQFQQALRLRPAYAYAHNNLGRALAELGQTDAAIEHYHQALQRNADYADAHDNLGTALVKKGEAAQAIDHFQEALRLKPDDVEICLHLGIALAAVGRGDEAIARFRQVVRSQPEVTEARYNLAVLLDSAGRTAEAIDQYREVLRQKPDLAEAHNNLGSALLLLGKAIEAIEQYREAARIKPDYLEAHYNLAVVLSAVGRNDEATAHARRALQLAESAGQMEFAGKIRARWQLDRGGRPAQPPQPAPGEASP